MSFEKLLNELVQVIDDTNTIIISRVTDFNMRYEWICIKPDLTYDSYYSIIKPKWNDVINRFVSQADMCESMFKLIYLAKFINISGIDLSHLQNLSQLSNINPEQLKAQVINALQLPENQEKLQNMILDPLVELLMTQSLDIYLNEDIVKASSNFINLLSTRSICFMWETLMQIAQMKYKAILVGKDKREVAIILKELFTTIMDKFKTIDMDATKMNYSQGIDSIISRLTSIHALTVESELNKLIPDRLASLKSFFVKTISYYFNNLHPVVWMQIIRGVFVNFIKNPPLTENELFQFISQQLLLNSGPFILKILQQVRPAMSMELMKKYNLTKLTYPVMLPKQYNIILGRVVKDWEMYVIDYDKSASVGHVFIVHRADVLSKFVIKVAKPLSMVQSCWEYSILNDLFPLGTCEQEFIHNMLTATGKELYAPNEVKNVKRGHDLYTMNYSNLFKGSDLDVRLTTIEIVNNIIIDNCWFAFAMTLAPGIPLSSLVEGEKTQLENDTLYRAILHRCLDLLIYKFYINIFQHGFYHGDLHAGNIYFSYAERQMTLIDFGAVGHIDIYSKDPNIHKLINIFIMAIFFNYDELLDAMTELINEKCSGEQTIDMNSSEYIIFRNKLKKIRIESIFYSDEDKIRADEYKEFLFSEERLNLERGIRKEKVKPIEINIKSPYDYIDIIKSIPTEKEDITNNTELLPYDKIDTTSKVTSFAQVLGMITEFYATMGINIAIKFSEFYELLKAYVVLIGVLTQTNYPSLRTTIIFERLIYDPGNLKALLHITAIYHMYNAYQDQKVKLDQIKKRIKELQAIRNLKD